MKKYNFDQVLPRLGSGCIKWDKPFETGEKDVLALWVADMDFACSDAIQKALQDTLKQQIYGYGVGLDRAYRKAICNWFSRRFDWKIDAQSIYYASGVMPAIAYIIDILSNPGDGIIVQTPVYYPFMKKIKDLKRVVVENPLRNNNGVYTMDIPDLKRQFARKDVKGIILCSPHNPVGRVWSKEELSTLIRIAKAHNKWILSDEIHCDIVRHNQKHTPLLTIGQDYKNQIITCVAPSKSFNLAGLQNSNVILSNPMYRKMWEERAMEMYSMTAPNMFALAATKAAYNDSEDWLDQMNAYVDENIHYVGTYIKKHLPNAIMSPCEGTYMVWIDVRAYCEDEKELEKRMLKESLILNEGYVFGTGGKGFERLNLACPRSIITACMERFCQALNHM